VSSPTTSPVTASNSFRIRTYATPRICIKTNDFNPTTINTYRLYPCKTSRINTYKKQGEGASPSSGFPALISIQPTLIVQSRPLFSITSNIPICKPFPLISIQHTPGGWGVSVFKPKSEKRQRYYLLQNQNDASHDDLNLMESKRCTIQGVGGIFQSGEHSSQRGPREAARPNIHTAPNQGSRCSQSS
jgi:hypothetical protein